MNTTASASSPEIRSGATIPRRYRGISLIELLIALALGSFLIIGVTQAFLNGRLHALSQSNQLGNQENSRFALMLLEQHLLKAGYRAKAQDSRELVFPPLAAANGCPAFESRQSIVPTADGLGVCLRYQRRSKTELDCLGNQIDVATAIVTRIGRDASSNALVCAAQGQPAQAFVTGISDIQLVYGVDKNADRLADTFIAKPAAGSDLVAVRVAILQRSDSAQVALSKQEYFFPLDATEATTAPDNSLYRSVQSTVTLRNLTP